MKNLSRLSDAALFASLARLARQERRNMPRFLARLAELDKRRATTDQGCSLFDYCHKTLRWSEGETARRIHVARAAVARKPGRRRIPPAVRAFERLLCRSHNMQSARRVFGFI